MLSKRVVWLGILTLLGSGLLDIRSAKAQRPEKRLSPGRPGPDVPALVEFYTHETTKSVKVFKDQIFVHSRLYSEPAHRLAICDGSGAKKREMVVRGAVSDFTVGPDGTIVFLVFGPGAEKRDKRRAVMLQLYDASGRHRGTHEVNRWLSPKPIDLVLEIRQLSIALAPRH